MLASSSPVTRRRYARALMAPASPARPLPALAPEPSQLMITPFSWFVSGAGVGGGGGGGVCTWVCCCGTACGCAGGCVGGCCTGGCCGTCVGCGCVGVPAN